MAQLIDNMKTPEQKETELQISQEYIVKMQKEGMWDKMEGRQPADPKNPYYMQGYNS